MILPLLAAVFNVGQVSSPFFLVWRCAIVFELGCRTCLWVSHLQSFPRSGYPDGFWTFGLGSGNGPSAVGGMGPSCIVSFTPIICGAELLVGYPKGHP